MFREIKSLSQREDAGVGARPKKISSYRATEFLRGDSELRHAIWIVCCDTKAQRLSLAVRRHLWTRNWTIARVRVPSTATPKDEKPGRSHAHRNQVSHVTGQLSVPLRRGRRLPSRGVGGGEC